MKVKPVFKTEHQALKEEINKRMDDVKSGMKELVKQVVEEKDMGKNIDDIIERKIKEAETGSGGSGGGLSGSTPGSKLSKMIDVIKDKRGSGYGDIINCPNCRSGHIHALMTGEGKKYDGISYKCTGPDCGKEFVMVDKSSDYKCSTCNAPIKRPEGRDLDNCPFCKGTKAMKFDWSRLWDVTGKKS